MVFGKNKYFKVTALLILFIILLGEIGLEIKFSSIPITENVEDNLALTEKVPASTETLIAIEIKGQVVNPGVYGLKQDSTIEDVIQKAGGLLAEAYVDNINLSQKIVPQMVIKVFSQKEYQKLNKTNDYAICYVNSFDISSCLKNGFSVIVTDKEKASSIDSSSVTNASTTSKSSTSIVNINTATKTSLMTLNGIGEAKAQAIIDYRQTNGNFKSIEEIKNVKGIGEAIYEKIKQYLKV